MMIYELVEILQGMEQRANVLVQMPNDGEFITVTGCAKFGQRDIDETDDCGQPIETTAAIIRIE